MSELTHITIRGKCPASVFLNSSGIDDLQEKLKPYIRDILKDGLDWFVSDCSYSRDKMYADFSLIIMTKIK